jgi:HK97 family phage major capsid protein
MAAVQTADMASMAKQIDAMTKTLDKLSSTPAKPPGVLFNGRNPYGQHDGRDWPAEQLKNLEPYDEAAVRAMYFNKGRANRVSGIGPYLCKMAGMAAKSIGHQDTLNLLRKANGSGAAGWDNDGYQQENFCKQFGAFPASMPFVAKSWGGGEVRKVALAEGSGQTGGYTVPPQFMNELLTIAAEDGFIEQRAKVVPMNTRTMQWPMLDITAVQAAGTTPYFGGVLASWQPEAALINETEPAFKQTEWTAWDLVLYTVSSNQLLADNGIALDALLTQLFGAAITWYKEFAFLQGLGAGSTMPLGVKNAPATFVQTRNTAGKFTLQDAAAMLSHLQIRSWDDAVWIMHQSLIPQLIQMVDVAASTTGSNVGNQTAGMHLSWITPFGDGKTGAAAMKLPNAFLNGLPLFFTEKVGQLGVKGDVMLVDWSRYVIGMRLDIQIDVSPHFLFRNNQLAWRVIARCDGKPWLNSPITDATGFQVSPYVCLSGT